MNHRAELRRLHSETQNLQRALRKAYDLRDGGWRLLMPRWWGYYFSITCGRLLCRIRGHRWNGSEGLRWGESVAPAGLRFCHVCLANNLKVSA